MKPLDPRLLRYARTTRTYLMLAVAIGLATSGLVVIQASILSVIIVRVVQYGSGLDEAWLPLVALLGVFVLRGLLTWASEVAAHSSSAAVKSELRVQAVERLLALGPAFLNGERTGSLATTLGHGIDALDAYFARYLPQLVLAALVPPIVLARIVPLDGLSAVIIVLSLPLIPLFMALIGLEAQKKMDRSWRALSLMSAHFLDVLQGLPTLRLFGRGLAQVDVIKRVTRLHGEATLATLRIAFLSSFVLELAAALSTAMVAVAVGLRLLQGELSLEQGLIVLLLTPEVYLPLRQVGAQFHASREGAQAAEQIFQILDAPARDGGSATVPPPRLLRSVISFEDTTCMYDGRPAPALDHASFAIRPGEHVALVGPSGAGKSTVLALLLGFIAPTEGRVSVGGVDLGQVDAEAWRRQVAWVPQSPYLVQGTIADNIRVGQPEASDAVVLDAARKANLLPVLERLPHGLETQVGELGSRLSAGQRQRVALARAFVRDAPLLLLDEPTANLDAESEAAIAEAVERLMEGRTVIMVAHRLDLTHGMDRVIVLGDGRVVEQGTPGALAARRGAFFELTSPLVATAA